MPLVTVIIPTYNRPYLLPRSISSIQQQTFSDLQLFVVDDGGGLVDEESLPQTDFQTRIIRKNNGGPGSARNIGVHQADSLYVAYLDDDDEWQPDHLSTLVEAIESSTTRQIVYSAARVVENNEHIRWWGAEPFNKFIGDGFYTIFPPSTCMHYRNLFLETNGFDENPLMIGPDDCELLIRISDRTTPFATMAETVVMHRDESLTKSPRSEWSDALGYVMKKNDYYSKRKNWLMFYRAYSAAVIENRLDLIHYWEELLDEALPKGTIRDGIQLRGSVNLEPSGIKAYCRSVLAAFSDG